MDNELKAQYDEMINDTHDAVVIGGVEFEPARILEELDPIAYKLGYNDYLNTVLEEA